METQLDLRSLGKELEITNIQELILKPGKEGKLYDVFGESKTAVLSPYAFVFFKAFSVLKETAEYKTAIADYQAQAVAGQPHPLEIMLDEVGEREAGNRKFEMVPTGRMRSDTPEEYPLRQFVRKWVKFLGYTEEDSIFSQQENELYKQGKTIRTWYHDLHSRAQEKREGPNLAVPPRFDLAISSEVVEAVISASEVSETEQQAAAAKIEGQLKEGEMAKAITEYGQAAPGAGLLKAAEHQEHFAKPQILGNIPETNEVKPKDLPEIVILRGVGNKQADWQNRIDFYKSKGVRVRFIDWPKFEKSDSFESQAEWLYEQLSENWNNEPFAFEAHSWGGLVLAHFMDKHPEMVSHVVVSGAPTRSNEEGYPDGLVWGLKFALRYPKIAQTLIDKIPAMEFFRNIGDWQEAFRVYLSHIGEDKHSQWDEIFKRAPWFIPKLYLYGEKDTLVHRVVGWQAVRYAKGSLLAVNPEGKHDPIGENEIALDVHCRFAARSRELREAVIPH